MSDSETAVAAAFADADTTPFNPARIGNGAPYATSVMQRLCSYCGFNGEHYCLEFDRRQKEKSSEESKLRQPCPHAKWGDVEYVNHPDPMPVQRCLTCNKMERV